MANVNRWESEPLDYVVVVQSSPLTRQEHAANETKKRKSLGQILSETQCGVYCDWDDDSLMPAAPDTNLSLQHGGAFASSAGAGTVSMFSLQ